MLPTFRGFDRLTLTEDYWQECSAGYCTELTFNFEGFSIDVEQTLGHIHSIAVVANAGLPDLEALIVGGYLQVAEDVGQNLIILRALYGVFFDPGNGGPGLLHLPGVAMDHLHPAHRGVLPNPGHVLLFFI